ncbi:hypothetical protein [Limnofasciculus baicalensis]|uniref:Uncharacterized protein n=1 Tax=Limnofasciculus baicalensis BBK-W-15 TaxID=2699891 RepID=A0AAE3KKB0_9CYAN|nr:hypothetical protein [Limnofasciculus baicalensis]MCP2727380.1 hypothetical protein [Limnofasciculus baicalensis BBK-W-15]
METQSIANQPSNSLPPTRGRIETLPGLNGAFLTIVSLAIIYGIVASIYPGIPKRIKHLFSFKSRHKILCHRCRYFSNNAYLKCALHPVTVLTKQVVNCSDYCLNSQEKRAV